MFARIVSLTVGCVSTALGLFWGYPLIKVFFSRQQGRPLLQSKECHLARGTFQVVFHLRLQVFAARSKDRLNPVSHDDDTGSPGALSAAGLALVTSASLTRRRVMHASRLTMFERPPKARTSCSAN